MLSVEPCTRQHIEALLLGPSTFEHQFGIETVKDFTPARQHLEASLSALVREQVQPRWWTHLFIAGESRLLVGMGGYRGNPDANGCVEIGYDLARSQHGQGLATEALRVLIARALQCDQVHTVCAHTHPRESSSTHTLEAAGMALMGHEPDHASWYWQISKLPANSAALPRH